MDAACPLLNIVGDRVALGPLGAEHADVIVRWQNDYRVMRTWEYLPGPRTVDMIRRRFEPGEFYADPTNATFAVYETATWNLIGLAGLYHVDHINRIAEYFIMIGDAAHRGKGYGTEATRLVLDHAFTALGLASVMLRVFEYNLAGIRAYEKVGFQRVGIRRKSKFMGGRMWDTVIMDAVAEDFVSPVLGHILTPDIPKD